MSGNSIEFTTHSDLDVFVHNLKLSCSNWEIVFEEEYTLLKEFDRAFWMQYHFCQANQITDEWVLQVTEHSCPFNVDEKVIQKE